MTLVSLLCISMSETNMTRCDITWMILDDLICTVHHCTSGPCNYSEIRGFEDSMRRLDCAGVSSCLNPSGI